jgi:hypothetical protein
MCGWIRVIAGEVRATQGRLLGLVLLDGTWIALLCIVLLNQTPLYSCTGMRPMIPQHAYGVACRIRQLPRPQIDAAFRVDTSDCIRYDRPG